MQEAKKKVTIMNRHRAGKGHVILENQQPPRSGKDTETLTVPQHF